jgi:hypothetical protein
MTWRAHCLFMKVIYTVPRVYSAGIFKQSMGTRIRVGIWLLPARQATQPGGSLESILGLLKSLKNSAQFSRRRINTRELVYLLFFFAYI